MNIEVLISTMNLNKNVDLVKKQNLKCKTLIINQITDNSILNYNIRQGKNRILSFNDKGLSKSRNIALNESKGDICLIADDDLIYENDLENKIKEAYNKYKDADVIIFYFDNENGYNKKRIKEGKINFIQSMKVGSPQISFKRKSIIENNIYFDEDFGASAKYTLGEDSIFLSDCLSKKLKIYSVPYKIATLLDSKSTWFKGYNKNYFISKGAAYYRMKPKMSFFIALQFAIRKHKLYKNECGFFESIKYMLIGIKERKKENVQNQK